MENPVQVDQEGHLLCPVCGEDTTHVEIVRVAARHEDQQFNEITVNAITGQIGTHGDLAAPAGPAQGTGRRQRVAVTGYCEQGGHPFALVFTQHKGATVVETITPIPHDVVGDPS